MLHAKALHYPSGFPMPRSPPLFICSSPGPDPYRSNDNVYEELEHRGRFSDCDRQLHSDEDFAEDELSLPGDRSLNKSSSENTTVATIYQERGAGSTSSNANENTAMYIERNRVERNSLLSSASSSANDNNVARPNMRNSSSSNESNHHNTLNHLASNNGTTSNAGSSAGFFRFRTSRPSTCKAKSARPKTNNISMDNLNSSTETTPADEVPAFGSGNSSGNNNTGSSSASNNNNSDPISASSVNGNHIEGDTNNNSNICGRNNYYGTESEVERRNRINAQLSNPALNVATIFRDRNIRYHPARANANYYAPPQQMMASRANNNGETNSRSRTNPRVDRRRNVIRETNNNTNSNSINTINNNQEYLYHEPVFHENMVYDPYTSFNNNGNGGGRSQLYPQPYILPEFTTFRNCNNLNNPHQPLYNSAMGSDSGYSQNTQTSGRSLWGRRKRAGNNNGNGIMTPAAAVGNETSDTYEGSWGRFLSFLSIMFKKSERSHHQKIIPKTTLF